MNPWQLVLGIKSRRGLGCLGYSFTHAERMEANVVSGADVVRTCSREAQTTSSHDIARAQRETHKTLPQNHQTLQALSGCACMAWPSRENMLLSNGFACLFQIWNRWKKLLHDPTSWCNFVTIAVEFVLNYGEIKNLVLGKVTIRAKL